MATRFYLPYTGTPAVSPAYCTSWDVTSIAARLNAVTTKISSALTTVSYTDSSNLDQDILFRQYVSAPLTAQTISAQTLKWQIRASETSGFNNLLTTICVRTWDGASTFQAVLALARDGLEVGTSLTNRQFSATTTAVTVAAGDRLVIEIGLGGDPATAGDHDGSLRIGDASASDLPENDTGTDDYNPWVEFTNTLSFATTYNETVTLAKVATVSQANVLAAVGSISLARVNTAADGSQQAAVDALGLARVMGLSGLGGLSLTDSISMSRYLGLSTVGGLLVSDAVSLAKALGISYGSLADVILALNSITYWKLDETSGTAAVNYGTLGTAANGTYSGATLAQMAAPGGGLAPYFDGVNDNVNVLTVALQGAFNSTTGSMLICIKAYNSGVLTDATTRYITRMHADSNNYVDIIKPTINNSLWTIYKAGGVNELAPSSDYTTSDWLHCAMTWDKAGDQVIHYKQGAAVETDTALGTFTGTLTEAKISNTSGAWYGYLAHIAIFTSVLTAEQIAAIYTAGTGTGGGAVLNAVGSVALSRLNGLAASGTLGAVASIALGRLLALATAGEIVSGGTTYNEAMTLAKIMALTGVAVVGGYESVLLARSAGLSDSNLLTIAGQISLARAMGVSDSAAATFGVQLSLARYMAAQASAALGINATISLAVVLQAILDGGILTSTPSWRVFAVPAESRVYVVAAEGRTWVIESEDRTYTI